MNQLTSVTLASDNRKKAIVISHERSGTHFLMNTLEKNFGYIARRWINLDLEAGINFHSAAQMQAYFKRMHQQPVLNIVKSHHQFGFYHKFIDYLLSEFNVFYIFRDPRDVMPSFWRFNRMAGWDEGARTDHPATFMRVAPRAAMLRYQKEQEATILGRWRRHVEGWTDFADSPAGKQVVTVRYETLSQNFDDEVRRIGSRIGMACGDPVRPKPGDAVILPGKGEVGAHRDVFGPADYAFIDATVGETMKRLGITSPQDDS